MPYTCFPRAVGFHQDVIKKKNHKGLFSASNIITAPNNDPAVYKPIIISELKEQAPWWDKKIQKALSLRKDECSEWTKGMGHHLL